ncbi:MAG: excinuclease ABC subunit UvrC [Bacilli bacterium]|nr:excinuclease ABC subunit UvrC [Bacilli bacterium]
MNPRLDYLKEKLSLVPHKPGSYQYRDSNGVIIYVGKAKDLKNRMTSYFNGRQTGKTAELVKNIYDFTFIVTSSELESFLLEINLIKKYNPKYNILLKDDKSYPYIELVKAPYPELKVVRYLNIKKREGRVLYGPFVNATAANHIVRLLNEIYPLKKCNGKPKDVCLYYHIHECLGYCCKEYDKLIVDNMINDITQFFNGNDSIIRDKIIERITNASENLDFERASELKEYLDYIDIIQERQKIDMSDLVNRDVFNYYFKDSFLSINLFFVRKGKLIGSKNEIINIPEDEPDEAILNYLANFYQKHEIPKEIIIPSSIDKDILNEAITNNFIYVEKGPKKKLLDLVYENAKINHENNIKQNVRKLSRTKGANEELENLLGRSIHRIESFDNSHLFGSFAVSAMVVFIEGVPSKNNYRKFKVSMDVNDDYGTMKEVTYRRYYRALIEKSELPDLILVDGGLGQIHAVKEVIDSLNLQDKIKVCGLVKNDKHSTNALMDGDTEEIYEIDKTSDLFHYLTFIQEEVHRFAITYHREIRSKGSISSVLDNIDGIGTVRKKELIKKFGSVKKMSEASIEELSQILPETVAENLKKYLEEFLKKN